MPWVKARRVVSKGTLTVGICSQHPNQDDTINVVILESLKEASDQRNLVLLGDLDQPHNLLLKKLTGYSLENGPV